MSAPIEKLPDAQYEMSAFGYCGVFMPKPVMEKLAKLTHRHTMAVREVLESHKAELHAAHWSMARDKGGKSVVYIKFVIRGESPDSRIKLFTPIRPERREEVFIVDSYDEANAIAESRLAAQEGGPQS